MTQSGAVPVVFLGGHGRSGSTLFSRVLGHVPGFWAVGELRYLWEQGVRRGRMCGCSLRFHDCPFWSDVGKEAFGGWDQVDVGEAVRLHRTIERNRYLPLLVAPRASTPFRRRLDRYAELMGRVYQAVRQVSGCEVIVDSSKFPSSAYFLRHVPDVDLRVVHLVRSSHGVCYSWSKKVARADRGGRPMARHPPTRAALEWVGFNFATDALRALGVPSTLLRYEDFVARPRAEVERVLRFLERERRAEELSFIGEETVELGSDHSVAGNPVRLRVGIEHLRLDEEWRTALPPRTRRMVTLLTAPGIARYGYLRPVGRR
ncbi:MAG: sulfotransferase [Streptosporangiales bacterium]|nr:sulfotransferase [Streptosporangiales bacterium]